MIKKINVSFKKQNQSRVYYVNIVGLFPKGSMFQEKQYAIFNFRKQAVYEKDPICKFKVPVIRTNDLLDLDNLK